MTGFTVPTTEPTSLIAGDRWDWTVEYPSYDNATYTLTYYLDGSSAVTGIAATATSGTSSNFTVSVPATTTAGIVAGTYKWLARMAATTDIHTVRSGVFYVAPNRATTTNTQTHNEKMLAAIEATLESRAVADIESYQINGRALNRIPFDMLRKHRGSYRNLVWQERNPGQALPSFLVRFGPA